jgi:hypothetical protein
MDKDFKEDLQNGQSACEKLLNPTNHWGNAMWNHNEMPLHTH